METVSQVHLFSGHYCSQFAIMLRVDATFKNNAWLS